MLPLTRPEEARISEHHPLEPIRTEGDVHASISAAALFTSARSHWGCGLCQRDCCPANEREREARDDLLSALRTGLKPISDPRLEFGTLDTAPARSATID